jgi:hypothetical protein
MPRPPLTDDVLRSDAFKDRLREADDYAATAGLDRWAARIVWVGLVYNVKSCKRYAKRRGNHEESMAWAFYCNLVNAGLFSEEPEGIVYEETPEYETDDGVMMWLDTLCRVAEGEEVPDGLPHMRPAVPLLRVVNGR